MQARRATRLPAGRDTIFAVATAPGRAAIAVVRVSGPAAGAVAGRLGAVLPPPRRATVARLRDGDGPIDEALLLWFPGPGSYTAEDLLELHLHGGHAVVAGVVAALSRMAGLRPAEPGEFTRRAVEAGRLDLTRAEAVADLVDAETSRQRRQAADQLTGGLASRIWTWRERAVQAMALLEATIDFSDEEIPAGLEAEVAARLEELVAEMGSALRRGRLAEVVRRGVRLAVVGPPNAGKSTLVNTLAQRELAIVSPVAGTTRDVIECTLDVAGMKVLVADTAGLRESDDPIEGEGVRRALQWASGADLHILVVDGAGEEPDPVGLDETTERILVANKADLGRASWVPPDAAWVSLKTGAGVEALLDRVEDRVRSLAADAEGSGQITRARHRAGVTEARDGLVEARTLLGSGAAVELVAEETRRAVAALGKVTGAVGVEDVLEVIFREFCIGK